MTSDMSSSPRIGWGSRFSRHDLRLLQHRMHQHIGAGRRPFLFDVFAFVMADSVDAGRENHRSRRDAGEVASIMPGARNDIAVRKAEVFGRPAHRADAAFVERNWRIVKDLLDIGGQADRAYDLPDAFLQRGVHLAQSGVNRMTEIHGHENLAGDHVARIGIGVEHADGRDGERRFGEANLIDEFDDSRGAEQRILAARHRGRAGMALKTGQADFIPALTLAMSDDADIDRFIFKNRSLFDMQFKKGVDRGGRRWARRPYSRCARVHRPVSCLRHRRANRRILWYRRQRTPPTKSSPAHSAPLLRWSNWRSRSGGAS